MHNKIGIVTTTSLVISSMIGTGVFTSLGYQVVDIKTGFSIIFLWLLGGVVAFCGAVSYAELGSVFKRSGGEYQLLRSIYHPSLGFVAGWVSVTVGFAAPAALAAMALAAYLSSIFPGIPTDHIAAASILLLGFIHGTSLKWGVALQDITTVLKVALILGFVVFGLTYEFPQTVELLPQSKSIDEILSPPFAVSLIYVAYAYTGWNSSIYVVDEIQNPIKNLPWSLFLGTVLVTGLYVLLNYVFLYTVPISELAGQIEVGFLSGKAIFGDLGGLIMAVFISFLLVSTVSAYVFLGPRVSKVMGEDFNVLRLLSRVNGKGIPVNAFAFSTALSLIFIYTSTFEQVLLYTSFLLVLITTLTVGGLFVIRIRQGNPKTDGYRTWGYPITPLIFVLINLWTLIFVFYNRPSEGLISVAILGIGLLIYFLVEKSGVQSRES